MTTSLLQLFYVNSLITITNIDTSLLVSNLKYHRLCRPVLSTLNSTILLPTCVPNPLLLTSGGHHWRPVHTCSLKELPCPPPPHQYWHLMVDIKTRTTGKRAVGILLECGFLHHKSKICTHLQTNDSSNLTANLEDILIILQKWLRRLSCIVWIRFLSK